jgi:hypothetical protein
MTMKKILFSLILLTLGLDCFSQVYKWRSTHFSSRHNSDDYDWTEWTEWSDSDILITAKDSRVRVFSQTQQTYDMISEIEKDFDKNDDPIYTVYCVDQDGTKCKMAWHHTKNNGSYVKFFYSNLEIVYKVKLLE